MTTVEKSIDVHVPLGTAYHQWTRFEEFPRFMDGVRQVRRLDDRHLHWCVEIGGIEEEGDAEITEQISDQLTLEDALPTQMPVYVNSVAYLFGVSALSALVMLILTGVVLAVFGPGWYHVSRVGHFVNSLHFWSVQVFFGAVLLHLITK